MPSGAMAGGEENREGLFEVAVKETVWPASSDGPGAIFTAQLAEQRSFRVDQIHQYETTSVPLDRPEAPADEEVRHALLAGAKIALAEIEAAQIRVVDGTFGRCVDCGGGVSLERLEGLPSVARCLTCDRGSRR